MEEVTLEQRGRISKEEAGKRAASSRKTIHPQAGATSGRGRGKRRLGTQGLWWAERGGQSRDRSAQGPPVRKGREQAGLPRGRTAGLTEDTVPFISWTSLAEHQASS